MVNPPGDKHWRDWLRATMAARGMRTKADLAHAMGVHQTQVRRWVDEGVRPSPESLREIAKALDVSYFPDAQIAAGYLTHEELGMAAPPPPPAPPVDPVVRGIEESAFPRGVKKELLRRLTERRKLADEQTQADIRLVSGTMDRTVEGNGTNGHTRAVR